MKQILIILFLLVFAFINATIINIPADQPTIQAGINVSVTGDTILVQPGAYVENIDFSGKNITVASYFLTLQDSSVIEQTLILGTGSTCVVTFSNNETYDAKLIGFTISGGVGYQSKGGGIYCDNSSPTLSNLIISGNHITNISSSFQGGGGIYCYNSSVIICDVIIQDNTVNNIDESNCGGGGLYLRDSYNATLTNLTVQNNNASGNGDGRGGGLFIVSSDQTTLTNLTVQNNNASGNGGSRGGGLYIVSSDHATLENLIIQNNSASSPSGFIYGGGVYLIHSYFATLENLIIQNNSVSAPSGFAYGGGLCLHSSEYSTLDSLIIIENFLSGSYTKGAGVYLTSSGYSFTNTEISKNYSYSGSNNHGGGIYLSNGTLSLTNTTITDNSDDFEGSGIYNHDGTISMTNSIIWNDDILLEINTSNLSVSYCDIEGGQSGIINNNNAAVYWLGVNLDADPLFVDAVNGDYHLTVNSPCIDAGSPYSPHDPDGTIVDMGVYYFEQRVPIADFTANVTSGNFPLTVEFTDLSIIGNSGTSIDNWSWDFDNDGVEDSYLQNPTYTYTLPGIYTVSLTVTDDGFEDTEIKEDYIGVDQEIVVTDIQPSPGTVTINEMETIDFFFSGYDPDGNPLDYSWKLDGVEVSIDSTYLFETNYTSTGIYLVTLDVTDNFTDNTLYYEWNVTVNDVDQPIVVNDIQPTPGSLTIDEMDTINFYFSGYDPDGNPLDYSWKLDGVEVSIVSTYDFITDYTSAGDYILTLEVTDNFGTDRISRNVSRNSINYSWDITVINVDQEIVVTDLSYATYNGSIWVPDDQTINEIEELNFFITATDPDGNPLEYSWKLDGSEMSTDASYNFTTNYTSAGNYVVTLDVTDSFYDRSESYRNELNYSWIVIVNDTDQTIIVTDIQPTPGAISIFEMEYINFFIEAHDPDGNPLEYSWKLDDIEVSTTIMYFFSTDYTMSGLYLVTLDVTDNFTDNSLYFEWNVEVIDVDQDIIVTEIYPVPGTITIDELDTINFYFSGYDPDGNPLDYSWELDGVEVSTDSTYTFETDYTSAGEYVVTFEVTDNFGARRISGVSRNTLYYSWDVTVNDVDQSIVVNELIPPEGDITIDEGDVINFSIDAYDPDGNDLEYSWQVEGLEVSVVSTFDFITDENSAGEYEVTLYVTDNFGTRNELNFLWNVTVNDVSDSGDVLIPTVTKLYQNHPNPFNPITTISFDIKESKSGILSIFNLKGQIIESQRFNSSKQNYLWNAKDCSSGVYLYKLQTDSYSVVKKMVLIK